MAEQGSSQWTGNTLGGHSRNVLGHVQNPQASVNLTLVFGNSDDKKTGDGPMIRMAGAPQDYRTVGGQFEIPIRDVVQTSDVEIDDIGTTERVKDLEDEINRLTQETTSLKSDVKALRSANLLLQNESELTKQRHIERSQLESSRAKEMEEDKRKMQTHIDRLEKRVSALRKQNEQYRLTPGTEADEQSSSSDDSTEPESRQSVAKVFRQSIIKQIIPATDALGNRTPISQRQVQ
jgi:hypothetical protein